MIFSEINPFFPAFFWVDITISSVFNQSQCGIGIYRNNCGVIPYTVHLIFSKGESLLSLFTEKQSNKRRHKNYAHLSVSFFELVLT